jgi:hypothetical protein
VLKLLLIFNSIPASSFKALKTPFDLRVIRYARLSIHRSPYIKKINRIFKLARVFITQVSILSVERDGD